MPVKYCRDLLAVNPMIYYNRWKVVLLTKVCRDRAQVIAWGYAIGLQGVRLACWCGVVLLAV
jgi:hypothetical protein